MRIYLDTSVYGRPFDDQSQTRVRREAEAFLEMFAEVRALRLICLASDILRLEVRRNPSAAERERIEDFLTHCAEVTAQTDDVLTIARELQQLTLGLHDALHLASAAMDQADDFLANRAGEIQALLARRGCPIRVMNPTVCLPLVKPTGGEGP